ncbi:ABC transporter permease [uncultured Draconibacterium sp.]|uniref:ABC transporter permease n=1 Tax=uncultured Draconibacterium sp. TaxID=1573823 RepID=UPI0025DEA105|nr:ABC transporter permease [uncultured Draconibacterium sp.]
MKKILKLAFTDFKLIFRDPSLKSFLVLPVIMFALIIWAVPPLLEKYDFLIPYLSLFLVVAVIENTQMFCFINTMVLIDEKESEVAKVYGVVPLSKLEYIVSRFLIPYLFTVVLNLILLFIQNICELSLVSILLISFLAALVVPVYALAVNSVVQNRMQGMVYVKAFNMLVLIPIAAFFVPEKFVHLFGIFPTHWVFQAIDNATQNLPVGLFAAVGFIFFLVLLWVVTRIFIRKHFA